VIGLTGRKRSGKDTIGRHLIEKYGFVRVAFADALKEACKTIFGFSDEQVYGDELKDIEDEYWGHLPREILQVVGTELFRDELPYWCRNITSDVWVRSVERKIQNLQKEGHTRFVITDVRYPNEVDFVKKKNGKVWKIIRPSVANNNTSAHSSEALIDNISSNNETINDSDDFIKINGKIWEIIKPAGINNNTNIHSSEASNNDSLSDIEMDDPIKNNLSDIDDFVKINGEVWKIIRSSITNNNTNAHSSEALIDKLPSDVELVNDSTINHLYDRVDTLMIN